MMTPAILITGALIVIGRATVLGFALGNVRSVVSGRRDDAGRDPAAELKEPGADTESVEADV
jgi:NAD(P)-dependent dehydrogenase (short-subunit alcohol dehydrogenase family)